MCKIPQCLVLYSNSRPGTKMTLGNVKITFYYLKFKYEAQTALFKDPVRTAQ